MGLSLEMTSLFSLYLQSHLDFHSLRDGLCGINKELAVPRSKSAIGLYSVAGFDSLCVTTNDHFCAVVAGIGGVFHNLCESLELATTIILLAAFRVELYVLAIIVAPETRPQRVSCSLHVSVHYEVFPITLGKSTATKQYCHKKSKKFLHKFSN